MKSLIVILVLLLGVFLTACGQASSTIPAPPASSAPVDERYYCTAPESDNGLSWKGGSQVCYDTQTYKLTVEVLGDVSSNQTTQGSFSGYGNGYSSGRIWTEGKGVLPVMIKSINPAPDVSWGNWLDVTLPYLLKTSDLGMLGVPAGALVDVICKHDVEALSPSFSGQTFTNDNITHELDYCRLVTKNYRLPVVE